VKTKWVCGPVNSCRSEVIVEEKEIKKNKVLFTEGPAGTGVFVGALQMRDCWRRLVSDLYNKGFLYNRRWYPRVFPIKEPEWGQKEVEILTICIPCQIAT
jgi:hypothetical protein